MFDYHLAFDNAWVLGLLVVVPLLWWFGLRSLSGLGRVRSVMALALRTVVLVLLILALAEMQLVQTSDRLTVIYLLDQSLSIPEAQRRAMIRYVNKSIREQRKRDREDRAGVIVFGRDAAVEIPPFDDDISVPTEIEALVDPQYTDLSEALKLARALFPHDAAKRVVVVTDGNENLGDAQTQARALIDAGVSIDVVPVYLASRGEVAVEKLAVSSDVRQSQPFDLRVVLNNTTVPGPGDDGVVEGKIKIIRRAGQREETLAEQHVALPPGKRVLTIRETIENPDFYHYEARFIPDNPADDALAQNNRATTFTHVRGRGQVLLIEDWVSPGEFDHLVVRLRSKNLEVTVRQSNQLFTSLAELQRFDTVVLANVPRSSGDDTDRVTSFSDEQIAMLVQNTENMGCGLVMLGGANSFGAGGWTNTELEKAMPVDFQVKNPKVAPVGALALIMHAGEMPRGNYWQKVVAREAIKALGGQDYCGLIHWNGSDQWLWRGGMIKVGPNRRKMLAKLSGMTPGDMPQFDPAMLKAAAALGKLPDAAVKHMIIISDGDPSGPNNNTIQALKKRKIKCTTVAVTSHGSIPLTAMQNIATATGGKYYKPRSAKALPKIYQREARRVARPLVYENPQGLGPQVRFPHEMIRGLEEPFPPITGFVLTTIKDNPLVEVALVSPKPVGETNATLLASWQYGLGRAVALTTDGGKRWATSWTGWDSYDKLFAQMVSWSMRPSTDSGNFTIATDIKDGKGRIVISALDKDDEYLNFLKMSGTVVGPDLKPLPLSVRQVSPGRYVGEFDADDAGSFFVTVLPGPDRAPIRTGVNVPYSSEFRERETNASLLKAIASLAPEGGRKGIVIEDRDEGGALEELVNDRFDPYRRDFRKSTASQDVWHLLVLVGSCLFFADVFNRRVNVSFAWAAPLAGRVRDTILRRQPAEKETETMSRLRNRKAAIDEHLDRKRAAVRFEPTPEAAADESLVEEAEAATAPPRAAKTPAKESLTPQQEEESYTERLLKAKQKVWKDRKNRE